MIQNILVLLLAALFLAALYGCIRGCAVSCRIATVAGGALALVSLFSQMTKLVSVEAATALWLCYCIVAAFGCVSWIRGSPEAAPGTASAGS